MKNLKSSDYEVGFADLQEAIRDAEQLLSAKIITLAAIRDASAKLLAAFDNLEERDEFSLTDDELDALFYHGAVLDEIAADPKTKPQLDQKTKASTNQDAQPSLTEPTPVTPAINPVPQPLAQPSSTPTQSVATALAQPATPDLTALATIIGKFLHLTPLTIRPRHIIYCCPSSLASNPSSRTPTSPKSTPPSKTSPFSSRALPPPIQR